MRKDRSGRILTALRFKDISVVGFEYAQFLVFWRICDPRKTQRCRSVDQGWQQTGSHPTLEGSHPGQPA